MPVMFNWNSRVLKRFIAGDQSHDNTVLTAITVSNCYVLHTCYRNPIRLSLGVERGHSNGTDHEISV